ncbi:uncharacterized protein B0I36DRAFT_333733 [Microdochium trichocladiopsis]|uniref:Uncharacterized protein n=1 Tax=Microdochium trichocladiopsis TaxID=1682393 RepID=A0A9P9BKD1_9PEZI|nr:uncharacterized protein B0I36DRAFT_333733 [Microdochium trichocladiopsis]KAH7021071.1 hypothetical protein B0I36DRAFT_333733 [Microdochium trichocladiopsis]
MPGVLLWRVARHLAATAVTTSSTVRRASETDSNDILSLLAQLPLPDNFWLWAVLLILNLLYIVPLCIYLSYAVNNLWPLLCIVESSAPSAYERIALADIEEEDGHAKDSPALEAGHDHDDDSNDDSNGSHPLHVTDSVRALNRRLYSIAGWFSLLRGLRPHMLFNFACLVISSLLACIPFMPSVLAVALAPLLTVQLYTTWVHIAISAPRHDSLFQRLPPFKQCFRITALPTLVLWLAVAFSQQAPWLVLSALDPGMADLTGTDVTELQVWSGSAQSFLVLAAVALAYFLPSILLVVPAHMVLTRVQASMLPPNDVPIVNMDEQLRPHHENNKEAKSGLWQGVSMLEAWQSFPYSSWIRLVKMYGKMLLVTVVAELFMAAALIVQFMLLLPGSGLELGPPSLASPSTTRS